MSLEFITPFSPNISFGKPSRVRPGMCHRSGSLVGGLPEKDPAPVVPSAHGTEGKVGTRPGRGREVPRAWQLNNSHGEKKKDASSD